ncbi:hypothetical protein SAMN05421788_102242 [Filimonas lacunae]|uniref:Uncharacterized protein n=1 Tax=Filimonas lacunae TaxID=477680 RepID=A0A173MI85_9BACT|nr:hypothetical protein [Filimonas lacunae]BAV07131.1 hypothetical protein FLA_3154 [Filimonas lacunae]SIS94597.1 hypothetical protein SAMN05421788_102242 [Filimonas lacunae]
MNPEEKPLSFVERMKQRAVNQQNYGGTATPTEAGTVQAACPNCGAGRTKDDGLTKCGYCGHVFIHTELTDGKYIQKEDNSL